jgi:hypothetical protein
MKKNIKVAAGKKLETVESDVREKAKQLKGNVRVMLRKLEANTAAAGKKRKAAETKSKPVAFYIGIDLGDKTSRYCFLDGPGSAAACCRFVSAKLASRRTKAQASLRTPNTSPYLWNGGLRQLAQREGIGADRDSFAGTET